MKLPRAVILHEPLQLAAASGGDCQRGAALVERDATGGGEVQQLLRNDERRGVSEGTRLGLTRGRAAQ
jgi:hypothetical protein